jgi:hypothetical protein
MPTAYLPEQLHNTKVSENTQTTGLALILLHQKLTSKKIEKSYFWPIDFGFIPGY